MHLRRPFHTMPSRLWRAVASLAAGLVMLLGFSAVSPDLHAWLHAKEKAPTPLHNCAHHASHTAAGLPVDASSPDSGEGNTQDAQDSHQCAVTMFSHGVLHHAVALVAQPCEGIL